MSKFLLVALFFGLALAATDDCLTYSYAPKSVSSLTSLSSSLFTSLSSSDAINVALNEVLRVSLASSSPFFQNLFIGQGSTNDFYMIKNCNTQQGPNEYCTSYGPQYIAYVRNTQVYGDNVRHVYPVLNKAVNVSASAPYAAETTEYVTSTRDFYTQGDGWTGLITYASGGQGKTFAGRLGTGLVAAATHSLSEYCGPCLSNSYAVAVSQGLAVSDFSSASSITSASGFSAVAKLLKTAMDVVNSTNSVNAIVGFENGDSYMVKFCNAAGGGTSECNNHVTNRVVYGDIVRRALELSADGTVGNQISSLSSYDVVNRVWYVAQNGWSDAYTFNQGGNEGRTYSLAINGGVVGTDRLASEPCSRGVTDNTCNQETSSSSLVFPSLLYLSFFLFLYFW